MVTGWGAMSVRDGVRSKEPVGTFVPCCGQFIAQHKRAAETCGVSPCVRATAQQSISLVIPLILRPSSLECRGIPASALLPRTAISNRDVSHFVITAHNSIEVPE